jgi:glyoxylase-like metal-dependent hydrolase (beta-lactamase superfamily II)
MKKLLVPAMFLIAAATLSIGAQSRTTVTSPRLYIFDAGGISGLDPKLFNFTREEIKQPDFTNVAYLIVHPKGTVMFEAGGIPDHDFPAGGGPVKEGVMTATRPLLPQLAAAGYTPDDITYLVMSHYHSDHTANANAFAKSTWIVQKAERDYMFQEKPAGIIRPEHYSALRNAKTRVLDNQDLDVFGDGAVVVMSAPGHTPGHQVIVVKLAKLGPVMLSGDLYHYPEEITTGRVPTFEFNAEQSAATRKRLATFLKQTGTQLWIEHDIATHAKYPKAPAFLE